MRFFFQVLRFEQQAFRRKTSQPLCVKTCFFHMLPRRVCVSSRVGARGGGGVFFLPRGVCFLLCCRCVERASARLFFGGPLSCFVNCRMRGRATWKEGWRRDWMGDVVAARHICHICMHGWRRDWMGEDVVAARHYMHARYFFCVEKLLLLKWHNKWIGVPAGRFVAWIVLCIYRDRGKHWEFYSWLAGGLDVKTSNKLIINVTITLYSSARKLRVA